MLFFACNVLGDAPSDNDVNHNANDNVASRYPHLNVQIIKKTSDKINPDAELVIFQRDSWVQPDGPFDDRCGMYDLPKVEDGRTITFYNKRAQVNILEDDTQYNEFWHIVLAAEKDAVTLQWTRSNGWIVLSQVQMPMIHSLRQEPTKFVHVLCPTRRIDGSIGDFVATVDTDKSSPLYGTIVNISWGSVAVNPPDGDPSVEYHHGGLVDIDGHTFLGAGSLRWNSTDPLNGGSLLDFHQLVSEKAPNLCATAVILPENAVHTVHMDPYSNNIIATALGTSDTSTSPNPSTGPGHFIEIIPNLTFPGILTPAFPSTPMVTYNLYTIGSDPQDLGPAFTLNPTDVFVDDWTYDFAINFCTQTMVSSSWTDPKGFEDGFNPAEYGYGRAIRVHTLELPGTGSSVQFVKRFETNPVPTLAKPGEKTGEGVVPLEVRRVHMPEEEKYFVGITLPGAVDYIYKKGNKWKKRTIVTPNQLVKDCKHINGKTKSSIPNGSPLFFDTDLQVPLVTDITLSGDDRYLYVSCWLAGCVVRYDIRKLLKDPKAKVKMNGGVGNLGGIQAINGSMPFNTKTKKINGIPFNGGPQMLRLTADGRTLFVTNSLFSSWDDQFYLTGIGSIKENGGKLIKIDTGVIFGKVEKKMTVDESFLVDFKDIEWIDREGNPATFTSRAHECHIKNVTH